jgi:hypothetical protein
VAAITLSLDLPAHFLDGREQRAGFVLLASFLISFVFIRTSARLMRSPRVPWWPGSVTTSSGVHLHHLVWGIVVALLAGFLEFVTPGKSPLNEILAAAFGVGAGLTLDEFALLIHLRDVYWAEEGRASLDAVIVATLLGGMIVVGIAPFDVKNNSSSVGTLALAVGIDLLLSVLAILKGRQLLGLVGLFIPLASVVGVLRLATPDSPWARRRYDPHGRKLERSQARWQRVRERRRRWADAIAGAPGAPVAAESQPGSPGVASDRQLDSAPVAAESQPGSDD